MSTTHLVLIPSFNTGARLADTIRAARAVWAPVWVVIDGSADGSAEVATQLAAGDPELRVLVRPANGGKGSAVLDGVRAAEAAGFTHVLTLDADGQHPADLIPRFMAVSAENPQALILGLPVFDESAPWIRLAGRRIANFCANLETWWSGIGDTLGGFRVYPVTPLRQVMEATRFMRGYDFDPEAAIRLAWQGHRLINLPAPIRYFRRDEGGVSHFRYGRDNVLLGFMYLRLLGGFLRRLPGLAGRHPESVRPVILTP